ncbi:MAG: hypothetical protein IKG52_12665 [Rhodobacteraceae bacterium]|nr:hypothetical protein [Paracoccaceae bacterium]
MVQKKEHVRERWDLPSISIESRELLSILNEIHATCDVLVTAETRRHKFESLEDIRQNIELFKGNVEVEIGSVTLNLSDDYMRGIRINRFSHKVEPENAEALAERLHERVSSYKTFFSYGFKKNTVSLLFASAVFLFFGREELQAVFDDTSPYIIFLGSIFFMWPVINMIIGYFFDKPLPVYFEERERFWSRNSDKIILTIIALVLGYFFNQIMKYLSDTFN